MQRKDLRFPRVGLCPQQARVSVFVLDDPERARVSTRNEKNWRHKARRNSRPFVGAKSTL
jgi:hypothetical protein